jgi:hypothetical protein
VAEYAFGASAIYLSDGSFATQLIAPSTITDEEETGAGSTTFEVGDTLTYATPFTGAGDVTFVGTATFEGHSYFYAEFSGGDTQIFGNHFPTSGFFPPNLSDFTLSPGAAFPVCFHEGSGIATAEGQVAVERLTIGDAVLTSEGDAVVVKWIGRQTVSTRFGPAERLMPVRFSASSLGDGLPTTDLTVTADHGMLVDGVICHAGALVNGTTITQVPLDEMGETYTVYHIETENHEIILANGAPAETFIDNVSRRVFDNFAEFEALYGDVPEMEELPYPRAMSARQVPERLKAKLAGQRAA